ncbi:hypothetical protein GCM10022393_33900 [Aquimarina addita]|uniref:Uncharacterized protein n=1 Tax=Aquimarina addita TaxID=870485 RepID=A0ABP6UTT1_9FLAO
MLLRGYLLYKEPMMKYELNTIFEDISKLKFNKDRYCFTKTQLWQWTLFDKENSFLNKT